MIGKECKEGISPSNVYAGWDYTIEIVMQMHCIALETWSQRKKVSREMYKEDVFGDGVRVLHKAEAEAEDEGRVQ